MSTNYVNILYMLLRLRQARSRCRCRCMAQKTVSPLALTFRSLLQACNHPRLAALSGGGASKPAPAEVAAARRTSEALRSALVAVIESSKAACPLCGDFPDDAVAAVCGRVFCRQCMLQQVYFSFLTPPLDNARAAPCSQDPCPVAGLRRRRGGPRVLVPLRSQSLRQ